MDRNALLNFARLPRPSASLPSSTLLLETEECIAIFDAYPKAKYHILVLPRFPSPAAASLRLEDFDNLSILSSHPDSKNVLAAITSAARDVEEMVKDEMFKTEGFVWDILIGFHAVPSMRHIHLHVISSDFVAPAMRTKKHYNSFRPDIGFFVTLEEAKQMLTQGHITSQVFSLCHRREILKTPLACFKCGDGFSNFPALKRHLDVEFENERRSLADMTMTEGSL